MAYRIKIVYFTHNEKSEEFINVADDFRVERLSEAIPIISKCSVYVNLAIQVWERKNGRWVYSHQAEKKLYKLISPMKEFWGIFNQLFRRQYQYSC